jgi:exopolyphosphatase/pppGpp-phosphohydrolase
MARTGGGGPRITPMRFAVFDLGSTSFQLLVAEAGNDGTPSVSSATA